MTDQLERELTDLFAARADATEPPPVPLRAIIDGGRDDARRTRRRRSVVAALTSAAVVVAVAAASVVGHGHSTRPVTPAAPTATPSVDAALMGPPTLPYLSNGAVHIDGRVVSTDAIMLASRGGTTYFEDTTGAWWHVVDGTPVKVAAADKRQRTWTGWHEVVLSPDGRLMVVLTDPTPDTTRLTAYNTSDDREIAHVDLAVPFTNWTGGGLAIQYLGIDARERVYWSQPPNRATLRTTATWMWHPGHGSPVALGKPFSSPHPDEPPYVVSPIGPVVDGVLGRIVDGRWQQIRRLDVRADGSVWSPSGATVAYPGETPGFLSIGSGARTAAHLPGTGLERWVGFESGTTVLGLTTAGHGHAPRLVRCDVRTGACAQIGPSPGASTQWATNGP